MKIYAFADEASPMIDQQIEAMKRNRLDGLEIRNVDGANVSEISLAKAKEVREKMDAQGLRVWSIGSPLGKISVADDFAGHLDVFRHTMELAAVLGSQNIRLFSFYIPEDRTPEDCKAEVIDRMGRFLDVAKEYGMTLCHENEKGIFGDIAQRCLILHQIFPELRGVFDPANFVQCGENTKKAWELLKDYIYYMHIKDALADGTVVPAGYGTGAVKEIAAAYLEKGGEAFTIEPHLTEFYGFGALEKGQKTGTAGGVAATGRKLSDQEAFDVACKAFRELLVSI